MAQDVTFDIIARDRASSTFSKVGRSAQQSEGSISKLGSSAKKLFAAAAIYQGAKLATKGLIGLAQAAAEDQVSMALLAKQFKNSAKATDQQIASTENWITAQGKARGVADSELRPALGNLITATHNVSKAQNLAGLAMDVSAAKGKPLATVSLALSKAYNGNVGALGRLGIKTKNAAGETLTFAQMKKRLNAEFGGAADAKAKTFTGLMDRFKVTVSEAGEALGYKLLPTLTRLANSFLTKGVPKIQAFVDGMEDGTGAGGKFVDTVKGTLLPTLKNLGTEAKLVVDAVSPFLKLLAKLPPQVIATGGAIGFMAPKIGSLRAPLDTSATKFEKFGRAASNAAGAAGLLVLTKGIGETNQTLGMLETAAGGAALGFAVGGPWGAAVGGAAGFLYNIFASGNKAAEGLDRFGQSASEQLASVDAFRSSVNKTTGAFTRLTKQEAARELLGKGAFKNANKLGLSYNTVTNAALGNAAAIKLVNDATAPAIEAAKNLVKVNQKQYVDTKTGIVYTNKQAYAIQNQAGAAKELAAAIGGVNKNARQGKAEALALAIANGKYAKSLKGIPSEVITKIGDAGTAKKVRAGIVDIALSGKKLSDKQIRVLLNIGGVPKAKGDIEAIRRAADRAAKDRTLYITVKYNKAKFRNLDRDGGVDGDPTTPRRFGGPVIAGRPYIVGETQPELFVPSQSGRIIPSISSAAASASTSQFNSLDKTAPTYRTAGMTTGSYVRSGNVDMDNAASMRRAVAEAVRDGLSRMKLETKLSGGDIIVVLRAEAQRSGTPTVQALTR